MPIIDSSTVERNQPHAMPNAIRKFYIRGKNPEAQAGIEPATYM